jgi:hypothetical protein
LEVDELNLNVNTTATRASVVRRKLKGSSMANKHQPEKLPEVTVTVEGVEVSKVLREQESLEIEKHKKREIAEKAVGKNPTIITKYAGNTSGARSERRDYAAARACKTYSSEDIANFNFVLDTQKGGNMSIPQAPTFQPSQPKPGDSSIGEELKKAQDKVRHYLAEKTRIETELVKWETVSTQLQNALDILSGKMPIGKKSKAPGDRVERGTWAPLVAEKLKDGPLPRKEVLTYLVEKGATQGGAYQALRQQKDKGAVIEENKMLRLP